MAGSNYEWIYPYVASGINRVVEVGSRDALDAISVGLHFDADVLAFEPNPDQMRVCEANVASSGQSRVQVRPEALSDVTETTTLWKIDEATYPNPGASSLFQINFSNRSNSDADLGRAPVQVPVTVQAARYDDLGSAPPDLLLLDVEGSELRVLRGFGDLLSQVRYIALEVSPVPHVHGGCSFPDVHRFLRLLDFEYVASDITSQRYLRLRSRIAWSMCMARVRHPTRRGLYVGSFNVLYKRS